MAETARAELGPSKEEALMWDPNAKALLSTLAGNWIRGRAAGSLAGILSNTGCQSHKL